LDRVGSAGRGGVRIVRAARPEDDSENDDNGGDGDESPGDFEGRRLGKIFLPEANVFDAREREVAA
jgi:hypothetical protein